MLQKLFFSLAFVLFIAPGLFAQPEVKYTYYKSGKMKTATTYVNGKKSGTEKEFYQSGQLKSEIACSDDKRNGPGKGYFENGNISWETTYANGKQEGVQKGYYENSKGKLQFEIPYVNDQVHGIKKGYHLNGSLKYETPFVNGKEEGVKKVYYDNGKLRSETPYKNGLIHGVEREYWKNDFFFSEVPYVNGKKHGEAKEYFENGKQSALVTFADDVRNGPTKMYYDNSGELKWEVTYVNGKKHGVQKGYLKSGKLEYERPYAEGKIHGTEKTYSPNGDLVSEKAYVNGVRANAKPEAAPARNVREEKKQALLDLKKTEVFVSDKEEPWVGTWILKASYAGRDGHIEGLCLEESEAEAIDLIYEEQLTFFLYDDWTVTVDCLTDCWTPNTSGTTINPADKKEKVFSTKMELSGLWMKDDKGFFFVFDSKKLVQGELDTELDEKVLTERWHNILYNLRMTVNNNNKIVLEEDQKAYSGSKVNGYAHSEGTTNQYVNGLLEGKWIEYLDNSYTCVSPGAARHYRIVDYKAGKPTGITKYYYLDGQLQLEGEALSFSPLIFNGPVKKYYENSGKLESESTFANGKQLTEKEYHENGQLKSETIFVNGEASGTKKIYFSSGKLRGEIPYKNGKVNGMCVEYYEDGKAKSRIPFLDDKPDGKAKMFDRNGKLIEEVVFRNGQPVQE